MKHKRAGVFYFEDEPQFATYEPRHSLAWRFRTWRNARSASGRPVYEVTRQGFGRYRIRMTTEGSPTAVVLMHGA